MQRLIRLLIATLLFFFVLSFPRGAFAANFTTDYNVTYTIASNANTHVSINVTLSNLTDEFYASQYTVQAGFKDIRNLTASDPGGAIRPSINKTSKGETITLTFNKKVIGKGNKLNFNLNFDTNEVSDSSGDVWEINVPGLSNQSDFSSFNVTVSYPGFLGKPAFIKPNLGTSSGSNLYFTKNDLGSSGISIAFGKFQTYNFNLTYHLQNNNLFPIRTEVAIPPQTSYQDIELNNLNPRPTNVIMDGDGNWLAQYVLAPSQKMKVVASGKAKIYLEPKPMSGNVDVSPYLSPKKYWETKDLRIINLAAKLKTPKDIYQYVVDTLSYDFSRVSSGLPRKGAAAALTDPSSAVCLEFTDLFVALARAAGIPAREIDGFANTKNTVQRPLSLVKDVLHAWPEYYDKTKNEWVMVDPTWGNTTNGVDYFNTLDFDHFAFSIKGLSSDYPVPAGGYKTDADLSTKDVYVTIGQGFNGKDKESLAFTIPDKMLPWSLLSGTVRISNVGSSISSEKTMSIESSHLAPIEKKIKVPQIPPYGHVDIPINIKTNSILTNTRDTIKIRYGNNTLSQEILVSPFIFNYFYGGVLIVVLIAILSVIAAKSGRLHVLRRFWKNPLRRKGEES